MAEPALPPARRRGPAVTVVALAIAIAVVVLGVGAFALSSFTAPPPSPVPASGAPSGLATTAAASPATSGATGTPTPAPSLVTGAAPPVGSIAALDLAGGLHVVTSDGRVVELLAERAVAFPAWSPDGSRIAVIHSADGAAAIEVFALDPAGVAGDPVTIYRSAQEAPFYLSWTPDGKRVSFLAQATDTISLRIAAADGHDPLDGTGRNAVIRRGAPLYFDWIDPDRLVVHVGLGSGAFLGEIGANGVATREPIARPGDFRSAEVSADGRFVAYVRAAGASGDAEVVVATRDGGAEHALRAFGPTAVSFAPTADLVATIGPRDADQPAMGFPIGPLRLLDAESGADRVLVEGDVFAYFWSPDGTTIAFLRAQATGGTIAASGSPSPGRPDIRLGFVDVATGRVRSDQPIRMGERFLGELLPYFDQYGLSHRLWAPDGSLILIPVTTDEGVPEVRAFPIDGGPSPFSLAADAAFWSP